ncbi:MAG: ADOP family duplicated permease [Vicinamibacterales bacterium]
MTAFLDWCVARALALYPEGFRARFGAAMALAFHERIARRRETHGTLRAWVLAFGALRDIAVHGLRERRLVRRREARGRSTSGDTMHSLLQDVRFGSRVLAKAPGFTIVATLVLALGIGSTSAVFGLVNMLLVQSRPGQAAGEVVGVYSRDRERPDNYRAVSYPEFADLRDRPDLFGALSGQAFGVAGLREGDDIRRVFTSIVTTGFFDTFGSPLALGRDFTLEEERPGADIPVAILSHDLWTRLGGAPDVVGSSITVNNRAFTVVGVASAGFTGSSLMFGPGLWVPTGMYDAIAFQLPNRGAPFGDRSSRILILAGRIPAGRSPAAITARLDAVAADLERAHPVEHEHQQYQVAPLSRFSIGTRPQADSPVTGVMFVLLALSGVVMLISALNVANMLLARADTRRKELAIRLAVGGSRFRIVRQLVTEGLLLALLGGAAGLLLATWVNSLLMATIASSVAAVMPAVLNLHAGPDAFVLGMTFLACVVCTLAFSLGPAWRMARRDTLSALGQQTDESSRTGRRWTSSTLVAGQVALSLMLLTVAGLFVRMSVASASADPGFTLDRGILINIDPSLAGYDPSRSRAAFGAALDRVRQIPGVEAASLSSLVPFGPVNVELGVQRVGTPLRSGDPGAGEGLVSAVWTSIGSSYFDALGLSMVAGREFLPAEERATKAAVAIIDEATATRLFPGRDAVGQFVQYSGTNAAAPVVLEVVGIAPPIRHVLFDAEPEPHVYTPYAMDSPTSVYLHVRTSAPSPDAEVAMLPSLRRELQAADPDLPILSMQTMPMFRDQSIVLSLLRLGARTFAGFGLMALFMATIGVYGVKAYLVSSRTREISIRVTLGAQPGDVLRMVLRQGLGVAVAGVAAGVVLSLAVSAAVQGVVLSGGAFDLPIFGAAAGLLLTAVLVASWVPARRATRVPATRFMRS